MDSVICDFLEFGWPLGYTNQTLPVFDLRTNRGALNFPSAVQDYLSSEISLGRVAGLFDAPPFPDGFVVSPLNTVAKRDSGRLLGTKSDSGFELALWLIS